MGNENSQNISKGKKINYAKIFTEFVSQIEELSIDNYKKTIAQSLKKIQIILDVESIIMVQADSEKKSYELFGNPGFSTSYVKEKYGNIGIFFPYFRRKIYRGEVLNFSSIEEMPDEAFTEKKILKERDIASLLIVPYVSSTKKLYAIICFSKKEVAWSESFILELSLFTRHITYQLEGVFSLKDLKDSETKFRVMSENTYDLELWTQLGGIHHYISPSCKRMTGYDREEFYKKNLLFFDIIHPDDLPNLKEVLEFNPNDNVIPRT
ncbi:MAG: PAS domain-containing protein, partial [Bacteroidales bacterium]|nr:PAS domain-containing protein [Bacteroidales bacterium]